MTVEMPGLSLADALSVLESWALPPSVPVSATEEQKKEESAWRVPQHALHRLKSVRSVPLRLHPSLVI